MKKEKHNEATDGAHEDDLKIAKLIETKVNELFKIFQGDPLDNLYSLFLEVNEAPFLKAVMKNCQGNQSRAARMLGLNRGTLRTKLKKHQISK